ncbi:RNA polymerase II subunit A C-terminal domain phosphatase [Nowakowskiella sp. JEL0407]|nr:RNA polymerase II subunit A C-terminal domain phosphatase [Nowakowskiella sp. JEL0407]
MEAHLVLSQNGFQVRSYGTGSAVRLPGPSIDKPNIYQFGTPYEDMLQDLTKKDINLYTQNGLISMLQRNLKIKKAPEKFQESQTKDYDLIVTCEERCFDAVCEDILARRGSHTRPVHLINIEIIDNHESAKVGAKNILRLVQEIEKCTDLDQDIEGVMESFRKDSGVVLLHSTLLI